ncbi:hypothetical protein BDQ17DRAFT_1439797 [Cyathus striatus]|nr:hypothetical protein BDQ17DRAFT_1439797 [Cyathus striatus]
MALASTVYNTFFKRNSVFVGSIFAGAFAFSIGLTLVLPLSMIAGTRACVIPSITCSTRPYVLSHLQKQWKDIRHKYIQDEA